MKSKRIQLILAIAAAALFVATLAAGLWPVESKYETSCGSFLASSGSVYDDAYNRNIGMMDDAAYGVGVYSENSIGLPTGAFDVVARNMANDEVAECSDKRQTGGVVAGVLLLLTLGAGATAAYLILSGRSDAAAT